MELKFDLSKTYAIALEGGGAKGGYEVGVWKALEEAGLKYNAVSGTSVGSLNGALMAMRDLPLAVSLWENIRFSQVMAVDDTFMQRVMQRDLKHLELRTLVRQAADVVKDGGLDVAPLRRLLAEVIDEDRVRASDVNFYLTTFSITDRKELDIDAKQLEPGQLHDMLLASAYFPAFKNEKLGGKRYTDGGVQDAIPINSLVSRGYRDIIAMRLYGFGWMRRVKLPPGVTVTTIAPTTDLGQTLNFSAEQSQRNLRQGYFDGQRLLYGLYGRGYYIDRTWDETQAYEKLMGFARTYAASQGEKPSLRHLHEQLLPALARDANADADNGDYYDLLIAYLETAAAALAIDPFRIRTDGELLTEILTARSRRLSRGLPKALRWLEGSF